MCRQWLHLRVAFVLAPMSLQGCAGGELPGRVTEEGGEQGDAGDGDSKGTTSGGFEDTRGTTGSSTSGDEGETSLTSSTSDDDDDETTSTSTSESSSDTTSGSSSTSTESSSSGESESGDTGGGCTNDDDCMGHPDGEVCNVADGTCVECTPTKDTCAVEHYCDAATYTCVDGCLTDFNCPSDEKCNTTTRTCEDCVADSDCPLGNVCNDGTCEPGCNATQPCPGSEACCDDTCVDLTSDPLYCGRCDVSCPDEDNAVGVCEASECGHDCTDGFSDCDLDPNNGCEVDGACNCTPNAIEPCYTGPAGTEGVGACQAGTRTCNASGTAWSQCTGEVKPQEEICGSGIDENCNDEIDEDEDADGDGWSRCDGDCCDVAGEVCANPELVNPGAFEVLGNTVDDDCDGTADNPVPACDAGLASNSSMAVDYAKAIDLCQFTTANPSDPMQRRWGVIASSLAEADGASGFSAQARSIRSGFGSVITARGNDNLVVLSTGHAADRTDTSPGYSAFQRGTDLGNSGTAPEDWVDANGGDMPNAPGCPEPSTSNNAVYDSIRLRLEVRVPTNANSFSVMMYFFSAEYPEWVCTPYNDFFVTLVDSTDPDNPQDGNIAVADIGGTYYPVGVNLVRASSGLFTQCKNGTISCAYEDTPPSTYSGCTSTSELAGSGFELTNTTVNPGIPTGCGSNDLAGGGTGWLKMSGNVTPGEVVTIDFAIWDTSDAVYDSLVLLDDFQWSVQPSDPGVGPG